MLLACVVVVAPLAGVKAYPRVVTALNTVSTDDAYINGHVTMTSPRVPGQVAEVLVDDNYRVKRGDILVRLDKEPYEVQVSIKKAAVAVAEADLVAANAEVRAQVAGAWADRFALQHEIESVDTQIANLGAAVATLNSTRASLELARSNLQRGMDLAPSGAISKEELDIRKQRVEVGEASVDEAMQQVYSIRVGLGLPAQPPDGAALLVVPPGLDQTFSTVLQKLGMLQQSAAMFGYMPKTWDAAPEQVLAEFSERFAGKHIDDTLREVMRSAPAIRQAQAKLLQAQRDLDQAELDLRYCDIVSEIEGVVTRRSVNPGDNVESGQGLMAVRSLRQIWIDANFKETQLSRLRIGQRVRCDVDMYGARHQFEGRISGFTMGTGQTLSLLPPQNATGNFVKIVQRLPVRVEIPDYDPEKVPLFVGLSVTTRVYFKEAPTGPHAGEVLRPDAALPTGSTDPKP